MIALLDVYMIENKKEIRSNLIAARLEISLETAELAASALVGYLLKIVPKGVSVAGYCSVRGEINLRKTIDALLERGNPVALPVVIENNKVLKFLDWSAKEALVTGKFGVSCPPSYLPEIIPEVVLVPLVGFDMFGNRLGYGGGYYDTTIAALRMNLQAENKTIQIIGVAYNMQKLETIPTERHDEKMDIVVTETGMIKELR